MLWIGLAVAVTAVLIVIFLRKSRRSPGPGYMQVTCLDQNGRVTSREWVKIKEPDEYPEYGAAQLGPYVERLFASTCDFATLGFFTLDGDRGGALWKAHGGFHFHLHFRSRDNPVPEIQARAFFEARNFATKDDYLGDEEMPWGPTRILSWWVNGDEARITELCQTVLRELCGVRDEEGLNITYEDRGFDRPSRDFFSIAQP